MNLEARSAGCFSSKFVVKVDDRPVGTFEGRWFSESLDLALTGRRRLVFRKVGWLSSHFELLTADGQQLLGSCQRAGIFTSTWELRFNQSDCQLVKAGWFTSAYEVRQGADVYARVDRLGWCERGWRVDGDSGLSEEDLLLVGLVYHTIQQREAQQHGAAGHTAGS
jgi:hypothetical protein